MRTSQQVAVYCVVPENERDFYILVKRSRKRGGFWQPLTGGVEDFDGSPLKAALRETKEELGISLSEKDVVPLPYSFTFTKEGRVRHEQCFGAVIPLHLKKNITLSPEHNAIIYSSDVEYLKSLLTYKENAEGLESFRKILEKAS
jgi:8-oxo-dGTP pyrophosphatase MutT (NUDIX family)